MRRKSAREEKDKESEAPALFQSPKRQSDYQAYRGATPDRLGYAMPILIGAAMIAAAILLSTLVTAVGTRFVGIDTPTEETMWLIDRLTGNVYKCQAAERGKASCEAEAATGSIAERAKH
jgi:ethanolamine utilization microcompartment shell protein EutL